MTATITPHLNFAGRAREALDFYATALDATAVVVSYGDAGAAADAVDPDQVIWGQVASDAGIRLMAYDVQADRPHDAGTNPFYVVLESEAADDVRRWWTGLLDGGEVLTDLGPSPFSPVYGMLRDRFGVTWVISVRDDTQH